MLETWNLAHFVPPEMMNATVSVSKRYVVILLHTRLFLFGVTTFNRFYLTDCCIWGNSVLVLIRIKHRAWKARVCMGICQQTLVLVSNIAQYRWQYPEMSATFYHHIWPNSLYNLFRPCWIRISSWLFEKIISFCVKEPQRYIVFRFVLRDSRRHYRIVRHPISRHHYTLSWLEN